jgi:hypothetical protein
VGLQKKKLPTAIGMQLFGVFFSTLCGQKNLRRKFKNILVSALKSILKK